MPRQKKKKKKEYRRCFIGEKRMLSQCLSSTKHLPMPYSFSSTHQHGAPSLRYSGVPHFPNWGITYENAPPNSDHPSLPSRLLAIGDIDTLTSHVYDRPLAITPQKCASRIKPSSHVFVEEEEEEEEKNIDVKRKSGCQRQLSLFLFFFFTRKQIPATHFV